MDGNSRDDYVRKDVYEADKETAREQRKSLDEKITAVSETVGELKDGQKWLVRTVGAAVVMMMGNIMVTFLLRG